jgi:hypothetical protein
LGTKEKRKKNPSRPPPPQTNLKEKKSRHFDLSGPGIDVKLKERKKERKSAC